MSFFSDTKSDYHRIKHLLNTEKITEIELTEGNDNNVTIANTNDNGSNPTNEIPDATVRNDNAMDILGGDNYARIQEEGNRRAERLSDAMPDEYDVDEMRNDGSRRHRGIGFDFRSALGGDGRNKLDEDNDKLLDSYEKEFFAIFNKAKEYQRRISKIENRMIGGADDETRVSERSEKKPRPLNETMRLTIDVAKKLKETGRYPDIPWKHIMQVSKLIIDDAKRDSKEITPVVRERALELASNPDEYVSRWRIQVAQKQQTSNENTRQQERILGLGNRLK